MASRAARSRIFRAFAVACSLNFTNAVLAASANGPFIEMASDLHADARQAAQHRVVLLIAVTAEGCQYCAQLKREILRPMILSGEYEDKVLIRELVMEPAVPVTDFSGRTVKSKAIARRYGVKITPTVLLLGPGGEPLHEPIPGINTPEMYGYYLDRAIDEALQQVREHGGAGQG